MIYNIFLLRNGIIPTDHILLDLTYIFFIYEMIHVKYNNLIQIGLLHIIVKISWQPGMHPFFE